MGEFEHSSNPRPLEELGFRVLRKEWGDRWQMHRLIVTNQREMNGLGFTDAEKAVYIACCLLRLLQDAPISNEAIKDILHRKYKTKDGGEEKRLSLDLGDVDKAIESLEVRGVLEQTSEGIYKEGWSFRGIYWEPEDVILKLKAMIEIDEIASMQVRIERDEDIE